MGFLCDRYGELEPGVPGLFPDFGVEAGFFDGGDDVLWFGVAIVGGVVGHGDLGVLDSLHAFKCSLHFFDTGRASGHAGYLEVDVSGSGWRVVTAGESEKEEKDGGELDELLHGVGKLP